MSTQKGTKEHVQQPTVMSIGTLARRWGVCNATIKRAIRAGSLHAVRVGRRYRIHVAEVARVEGEAQK